MRNKGISCKKCLALKFAQTVIVTVSAFPAPPPPRPTLTGLCYRILAVADKNLSSVHFCGFHRIKNSPNRTAV